MDNLIPDESLSPEAWTVEFAQVAGYGLTVYCRGPCRSGRDIDLLALAAAGRAKQRIADLKFRCPRCGAPGAPIASWWEAGRASWDYGRRELRGELPGRRKVSG